MAKEKLYSSKTDHKMLYAIAQAPSGVCYAKYRRGYADPSWHTYVESFSKAHTWEEAYTLLEKHANPAVLAVRFVGTF